MELSNCNIKKFLIFHQKKAFLIFPGIEPCAFSSQAQKIEKNSSRENFLYLKKRKPRRNLLYFLKRKLFLYFRKRKPQKAFYI